MCFYPRFQTLHLICRESPHSQRLLLTILHRLAQNSIFSTTHPSCFFSLSPRVFRFCISIIPLVRLILICHIGVLPFSSLSSHSGCFLCPPEVINLIYSFVPKWDLLCLHCVCRDWLCFSTRFTHNCICLSLPPNWQEFRDSTAYMKTMIEDYMMTIEVAVIYLMSRWSLTLAVESVKLVNWPLQSAFPNVHVFSFVSNGPFDSPTYALCFPYGYCLPPMVEEVILKNCCMLDCSVEELLGPQTKVHSLTLYKVVYGYLVHLSTFTLIFSWCLVASPQTMPLSLSTGYTHTDLIHLNYWQMWHSLGPEFIPLLPSPPTLWKLSLDFLCVYDHLVCTENHLAHLLHNQLFSTPASQAELAMHVPSGHIFPVATHCKLLMELEIIMGDYMWCVLSDIWSCISSTLSTLSLIIHKCDFPSVCNILNIRFLLFIQRMRIAMPLEGPSISPFFMDFRPLHSPRSYLTCICWWILWIPGWVLTPRRLTLISSLRSIWPPNMLVVSLTLYHCCMLHDPFFPLLPTLTPCSVEALLLSLKVCLHWHRPTKIMLICSSDLWLLILESSQTSIHGRMPMFYIDIPTHVILLCCTVHVHLSIGIAFFSSLPATFLLCNPSYCVASNSGLQLDPY